jgi:hypothetical protein
MLKNLLCIGLFLTVFTIFNAQGQYSGIWQTSNNAGVREAQLNPASVADSRLSIQVHLGSIYWVGNSQTLKNELIPHSLLSFNMSDNNYKASYSDISGPGLMAQGDNNHAFVFSTRLRSWQTENSTLTSFFEPKQSSKVNFQNESYSATALQDVSFGYALPVLAKGAHFIKAGAAIKFYKTISRENYTFSATDSTLSFVGNVLDSNKDYAIGDIFGTSNGKGYDIGFSYEYRPKYNAYYYKMDNKDRYDVSKTKYALKFSVSLLDLGGYSIAPTTLTNKIKTVRLADIFSSPYQSKSVQAIITGIQPNYTTDSLPNMTEAKLPSTFIANLDVHLGKTWYVNALYRSSDKSNAYAQPSVVALAFRTESVNGSWSMPVAYDLNNKKVAVGFHARMGSFFVGTDNIMAFNGSGTATPAFYAGMSISIRAQKIKDDDFDSVSNSYDKCPKDKGIWQFRGCADTDGDGIPDKEDQCIYERGPQSTHGCKDSDGDGIPDKEDQCKDKKGPISNGGCPIEGTPLSPTGSEDE